MDRTKLTPMMQQYFEIKDQYPDHILFYRLGDFYEMFFDDAVEASRALDLTLTARNCGLEEKAPLCGVPYHASDQYLSKLIDQGFKVAICEQVEDPKLAKGLVKREVVQVLTPGTVVDPAFLEEGTNNYILSVISESGVHALAYGDLTTGLFKTTEVNTRQKLIDEILKIDPSEIIHPKGLDPTLLETLQRVKPFYTTPYHDAHFGKEAASESVLRQFEAYALSGLGLADFTGAVRASGALVAYLEETSKTALSQFAKIRYYQHEDFMILDGFTRSNLELIETIRKKDRRGSLLWVLDKTRTAMGARLLRHWLLEPSVDVSTIEARQDAVGHLVEDLMLRSELRSHIGQVYDLERLATKIVYGRIMPRDLIALKTSLVVLPEIDHLIADHDVFDSIRGELDTLEDLYALLEEAIVDEPPTVITEGGIFRDAYHPTLAELRDIQKNGKDWILDIELREKERLGIKSLKIGFNKVFGYYLDVTKANTHLVPEDYIRKQTLANSERYITPELKELEAKILGAEEKMVALETELYTKLRTDLAGQVRRLQQVAAALAQLDCLLSLAEVAYENRYVRPSVSRSPVLKIEGGRHPVVEALFSDPFIANDTHLDREDNQFYIITGPNMAGKSTYLRQVALITLMAQMGSFVPAESAEIGLVDRIFTRVGASDDLGQGQSTFMVEMSELANILNNATDRSLIILDEIGRGTSTFDGLSLAWSAVEFLTRHKDYSPKTIFATHYHELTELEGRLEGVKNFRIAVEEVSDDIVFLRKIERGGAQKSYGIQVAKLAGLPDEVINRAREILRDLEDADLNRRPEAPPAKDEQLTFVNDDVDEILLEDLAKIRIEALTPLEALNTLNELVQRAKEGR
jgi:DNA mismatch repair protein MutS